MDCLDAVEHHDNHAAENREDQQDVERLAGRCVGLEDDLMEMVPDGGTRRVEGVVGHSSMIPSTEALGLPRLC